jgi:hypothetical protein
MVTERSGRVIARRRHPIRLATTTIELIVVR